MKRPNLRTAGGSTVLVLAFAAGLAQPALAASSSVRTTFLLSRSLSGGLPNGPSRNGVISGDARIGRVAAYESDASNIVSGDTNGVSDVFLVYRAGPWGLNGTFWRMGRTELASTGLNGAPANGASYLPSLGGGTRFKPRCVAFVSEASNLVPADTNGVADAFLRNLSTGRITRVSVSSSGEQANGPTSEVSVSGDCRRVAFTSTATNLGLVTNRSSWRSAATVGSTGGHRQVFVRILSGKDAAAAFAGMTFVASSNRGRQPANGDAFAPSFARDGKAVAFASVATNLSSRDRNRHADVYLRSFLLNASAVPYLRFSTRLVSVTRSGVAGNGPSTNPSASEISGRYVAYETAATNLLPGDRNGVVDIARADLAGRVVTQRWVTKSVDGIANGGSAHPDISAGGDFVFFDSIATNLRESHNVRADQNGNRDAFVWNAPTNHAALMSRDWQNGYLPAGSSHPRGSLHGNYLAFQSVAPAVDRVIRNPTGGEQVYFRYLGPK